MVKVIGLLLVISSIISLIAGAFIEMKYGASSEVSGNVLFDIISQPDVGMDRYDYIEAAAFSYSIISMITGLVFLFRI